MVATAQVMPVSEGTVTLGGPSESTTVTVVPCFCEDPAAGLCATMSPVGMVMDCTLVSEARTFMWTLDAADSAAVRVRPLIAGTGCDGVKTLASNAAASPPAMTSTAAATAATIQAVRCERFAVPRPRRPRRLGTARARMGLGVEDLARARLGPDRRCRRDGRRPGGPAAVPAVPAFAAVAAVAVVVAVAVPAATSVSSATPGRGTR